MTQGMLIDLPPPGWSINRLSIELRLDRRTITQRLQRASVRPLGETRDGAVYALADAARACFEAPITSERDELERRRLRAQTEQAELELERRRGTLVAVKQVVTAARTQGRSEREAWWGWPARAGPVIAAELGVDATHLTIILDRELRNFMHERGSSDIDPTAFGLDDLA